MVQSPLGPYVLARRALPASLCRHDGFVLAQPLVTRAVSTRRGDDAPPGDIRPSRNRSASPSKRRGSSPLSGSGTSDIATSLSAPGQARHASSLSSFASGEKVQQLKKKGKKLLARGAQKLLQGMKKLILGTGSLLIAFLKNPRIVAQWYEDVRSAVSHFIQWVMTGFRLFGADVRASYYLTKRVVRGYPLTLRERQLLVRTTSDCLKLIPFSLFIIIPFAEVLLPFFLRLFPNMLPSTFFQRSYDNATLARRLKAKEELAEFFQQVVHQRTKEIIESEDVKHADKAEELQEFQDKLMEGKEYPSLKEITRICKIFEKELSLERMSEKQLHALSSMLQLPQVKIWWPGHAEVQLRHHITQLRREDRDYLWEGIDGLSTSELIEACRKRNIRFHEVTEDAMRRDLARWLEVSSNRSVPTLALLWIQSFYLRGPTGQADQHIEQLAMDVTEPEPTEQPPEEAGLPDKAFGSMAERQRAISESAQQKLERLQAEIDEVIRSETAPTTAESPAEEQKPGKEREAEIRADVIGDFFEEEHKEKQQMKERLRKLDQSLKLYRDVAGMQKILLDNQLKLLCTMRNNTPSTYKDADMILLDQRIRLVEMVNTFSASIKDVEKLLSEAEDADDEGLSKSGVESLDNLNAAFAAMASSEGAGAQEAPRPSQAEPPRAT